MLYDRVMHLCGWNEVTKESGFKSLDDTGECCAGDGLDFEYLEK